MSSQNLIILFGGESRERLVSVATAQNITQALPEALCWFWAADDQVYQVSHEELLAHTDVFKTEFRPSAPGLFKNILEALDSEQAAKSIFVIGVHGGRGENGVLQDWLETRKIAFTGPDSKACRLCMDKTAAKKVLEAKRVRVSPACLGVSEEEIRAMLLKTPKLILKPNSEGSSFGLLMVTVDNLETALQELKSHPERQYLLEAYVSGTELTVGVCDTLKGPKVLVPTELRALDGFADYDGKYLGLGTQEITPAEVSESVTLAAQRMALVAHDSLGCEGYSRTDMIVDEKGPVYLETNSLPGLTKASLVPQALAYEGISIREFLLEQVELAHARLSRSL
ncbi:MAG: ATP-grasp domain-containing protein [Myxococcaceae bacterium]